MRKRFEPQLEIGQLSIEETPTPKSRDGMVDAIIALRELYKDSSHRDRIFEILENKLVSGKSQTGRPGMCLWVIFVLAQIRLTKQLTYDELHTHANYNALLRRVMGVARTSGIEEETFSCQTIVDNVGLLDDDTVRQINEVIVSFGHKVFKKKEEEAMHLKSDSFVVESNVHFPTDYNLMWDCLRKCLDQIAKLERKYGLLPGWRKSNYWRKELKSLIRSLGQVCGSGGKNKATRIIETATLYIQKAEILSQKIKQSMPSFPLWNPADLKILLSLEYYHRLLVKHIDLVERRLLKGETISHEEKMFSVFETYTEWINKGKHRPEVELGKKVTITTDQYHLIIDWQTMHHQSDSEIVLAIADRLMSRFKHIETWSFDKGYWHKDNRTLLETAVPDVIMPKKGKCNRTELEREHQVVFKKYRNRHSAVESNIHSLETRGLSRCPDRGVDHFNRYVALGVCAYNLCCIGRKLKMDCFRNESRLKKTA